MGRFPVFKALIGSYLRHERGRTLLTILGVALGVAVLVAIDLANESAVASFKRTVSDVAGRATLTVRGNGAGIDPALTRTLAKAEGVEAVAPLIEGTATFVPAEGSTETLTLLAVDLLAPGGEEEVRDLSFQLAENVGFTDLLTSPGAMIFAEGFLNRAGLALGERTRLRVLGLETEVFVAGVVRGSTYAEALGGNVAVMDLGNADLLLRRGGRLDRIDLITTEGLPTATIQDRLARLLPPTVSIERPEARSTQVDNMLAAFRFNLGALGHISLLVGAFLIYNTMSIAVVRRREVIGTLRALGISRRRVRWAFLAEGLLMGAVGGVLGIVGGIGLAAALLDTVSAAISINFVQTNAESLALSPGKLLFALGLGMATALAAAWGPAAEASATPPANTMRRGSLEHTLRPRSRWRLALGLASLLAGAGLLFLDPRPGLPIEGYAASLAFVVAFLCAVPGLLDGLSRAAKAPYARLFGAEGLLAISSTQSSLGRASVAIGGLMLGLGMTISVSVMVASFRDTVVVWMQQVLQADLYVSPRAPSAVARAEPMDAALADRIEALDGVAFVDPFRTRRMDLMGAPAFLGAGRLEAARFSNEDIYGRPMAEVLREAKANDQLIVSEAFARKRGLERGDTVAVPTPGGLREFVIASVYYDYSSEQGYAIMDRELYLQLFDDPLIDSVAVYLKDGADPGAARRAIEGAAAELGTVPPLRISANSELRGYALEAFDRTFGVTYVLQFIAIIVAVLGVATTLFAQILDRADEILALRYVGASKGRVAKMIALESALLGFVGVVLGVASGLALSWILTKVIMIQSFGWTIQYEIPWLLIGQIALVVFGATLAASVLPAREAVNRGNGRSMMGVR
ncbi:MAG: FtsX-like permease family protein [Sumerlaeia bacterium]